MMKQDKKLIAGNWKMNLSSLREAKTIFGVIKKKGSRFSRVQTVICPPFLYIEQLRKLAGGGRVQVGAQDMFWKDEGEFTGEISGKQLRDLGVNYVILGHSERRVLGETNQDVNKKIRAAIKHSITPVVCIGEPERGGTPPPFGHLPSKRGGGTIEYLNFVKQELEECFEGFPKTALARVIIAYEPIWAIGAGAEREATPEESLEMALFIKKTLADFFNPQAVEKLRVLYGGSANERNAEGFLRDGGVDGLLVGRASLNPAKFEKILEIANTI